VAKAGRQLDGLVAARVSVPNRAAVGRFRNRLFSFPAVTPTLTLVLSVI
jgi:hypothetical protein